MRKIQFTAALVSILLALPFTFLAIIATAFLTENLIGISTSIARYSQLLIVKSRDLLFEAELAGLIASIVVILTIMMITYLTSDQKRNVPNK